MTARAFCLALGLSLLTPTAMAGADQAANTCVGKTGAIGSFTRTVVSGGIVRTYRLDIPPNYASNTGSGIVFNFHGLGDTNENFAKGTGMPEVGNAAGFIVVHPQGYENSWNAGTCCGQAALDGIDDVQFVRDMIDDIGKDYCVDPEQIFSSGFSNGGYMSHRLGCEGSDFIAAITPVSGLMAVACEPGRPVPVHQSHGMADLIVGYDRGYEDVAEWAAINGCAGTPETYYKKLNVTCVRYPGCKDGADVEFCSLRGVNHKWVRSSAYDTTTENINFFLAHPMP